MRNYFRQPNALRLKKIGQAKRYRETIPERKNEQLLRAYGISFADYQRMSEQQGHVCAICEQAPVGGKGLAVDHCHETGTVRGLLCLHCNYALGHAKDDPDRLRAMADYLERSALQSGSGAHPPKRMNLC